jgi:hypothetical protein
MNDIVASCPATFSFIEFSVMNLLAIFSFGSWSTLLLVHILSVGESENQMGPPNTSEGIITNKYAKVIRNTKTKNLRKSILAQKLWISLRVPSSPFYRETKGILHSKIALESKEYSKCEHVRESLSHPVICELISHIYKSDTSSHF